MGLKFADLADTGPATLAGRYLRAFWQPVFVAADLAAKETRPIRLMGEDFTLYRGQSGTPYVVASKCGHRNTVLHTGWVEGEAIRCLYHGWTYDGTGQCIAQPAEPQPFCDKIRIAAYPVQEYLGLIFVYLGEGEPPAMPRFRELEGKPGMTAYVTAMDDANWLNRFDNMGDVCHPVFTHPQIPIPPIVPKVIVEEHDLHITNYADFDGHRQPATFFMPNTIMFPAAMTQAKSISWLVPVDDEHARMFGVTEVPQILADAHGGIIDVPRLGKAIIAGEMTIDDIMEHPAAVSIQDYVAIVSQGHVRERPDEKLGREDAGVRAIRKMWLRELETFAAGAPARRLALQ